MSGDPQGGRSVLVEGRGLWTPALGLLLTLAAVVRLHSDGALEEPFAPYADQTFQAVLVVRSLDPGAYDGDVMVAAINRFWPDLYFEGLAWLAGPFDDLRAFWSVLTLGFAFVLLTGTYRLGRDLFRSPVAGLLAGLATALVPRDALIAEWAVVPLVPRVVTLSLAPWILHAVMFAQGWRLWAAFFGCGLTACAHSLSALQLCALAMGMMIFGVRGRPQWRTLCLAGVAAGVGALPAMLALPGFPDAGGIDRETLRRTCFAYFEWPYFYKALQIGLGWLAVAATATLGALLAGRAREAWSPRSGRFLLTLSAVAMLGGLTHLVVVRHLELLALSPLRLTKYLHLAAVLGAAGVATALWADGRASRRMASLLVAGSCLVPLGGTLSDFSAACVPGLRERLRRSVADLPTIFHTDVDHRGQEAEVRAFARLVQQHVEPGEVVLVPPRGASLLRLWSRRAMYVTGEDSVVALYDADSLDLFFERLDQAVAAYQEDDLAALEVLAKKEGCGWFVSMGAEGAGGSSPPPSPGGQPPVASGAGMFLHPVRD